jgi:hypothetical protein
MLFGCSSTAGPIHTHARHHIFSAIFLGDLELIRQVTAQNPGALGRRMSRFEQGQTALTAAMLRGDRETMTRLVAAGARPPEPAPPSTFRDGMARLADSRQQRGPADLRAGRCRGAGLVRFDRRTLRYRVERTSCERRALRLGWHPLPQHARTSEAGASPFVPSDQRDDASMSGLRWTGRIPGVVPGVPAGAQAGGARLGLPEPRLRIPGVREEVNGTFGDGSGWRSAVERRAQFNPGPQPVTRRAGL